LDEKTKFSTLLEDPELQKLFSDFLKANHCTENLEFWKEVDTYLSIDPTDFVQRRDRGLVILKLMPSPILIFSLCFFRKYVLAGAEHQVNLDNTIVSTLDDLFRRIKMKGEALGSEKEKDG